MCLYEFPGKINANKAYRVMTNSSGNQPSKSLLCDIIMYANKGISTLSAKQWCLTHEAYLKRFEETHSAVEVV
jgi:hypothetical protein